MLDTGSYIHNLKFNDGIWEADEIKMISYPGGGNSLYYEIEDQSFWFKNRNRIIYEAIKSYSIPGPIFDVAGGNGFVSSYLCKMGLDAVLIEPGPDGCKNGKGRGLQNIINSNFDATHFYPDSISNIGIFDVLEHIENQYLFLETLHTNLVENGRLFITVPGFRSLWSEEDKQAGHYRRYCIKELHEIIKGNGFEVLYATYFYSFLVFPIFLFRTIPSKLGFYKPSAQKSKMQHLSHSDSNKFIDILMKFELAKVKKGGSTLFGSSILLVARKR